MPWAMTGGSKKTGAASRDKRLAAALRENLKRRKAQERAQPRLEAGSAPSRPRIGFRPNWRGTTADTTATLARQAWGRARRS